MDPLDKRTKLAFYEKVEVQK